VSLTGGKIAGVKGDPDCPFNKGLICPKGRALPELLYHPDRLKFPLRRMGDKGEGKWQKISMDEALDTIARKLKGYIEQFGAESILLYEGAYRGLERAFIQRLASVLATPNTVSIDNICHAPRTMAARYTYGRRTYPDYDGPPKCLIIWGRNSFQTCGDGSPARFRPAFDKGARFIVIDPRRIALVSRADVWLKPRPGSDGLLALAMLNVIINHGLYDRDFVDKWTVGFDQLRDFIAAYPPGEVADRTWIPKPQIEQAARTFATTKPAAVQWGNGLDQTSNAFQTCRAIAILEAITGNLDVPGGGVFLSTLPVLDDADFALVEGSPRNLKEPIGSRFKLAAEANIVPSQEASRAILEEKPYPLRAAMIFGSNPLLTYANARETYEAFKKLNFLVVVELFMTPTTALADIVLPVAANLEYDALVRHYGCIAAHPKIVDPPGECRSDVQWMSQIAKRMGYGKYFWEDEAAAIDTILQPASLTLEELRGMGIYCAETQYKKYEEEGFQTPSGKVKLFSDQLQEMGIDPLPTFCEPPQTPFGSPELTGEYPLVLTNYKNPFFFQASHRNIPSLRKLSPEPIAELNPETGTKLGLSQGDLVYIETPRGRIRQRLRMNADLDPRVVVVAHGWWFPERGPSDLYGWREANLNILTDSSPPHDPAMGTANLRGLMCKVYKA
jgi:anaerobic selenocysteine-containing dehydrogenase